jgi:hypothetical protein
LLFSLVTLLGGVPEDWGRNLITEFSRSKSVLCGGAAYLAICAAFPGIRSWALSEL